MACWDPFFVDRRHPAPSPPKPRSRPIAGGAGSRAVRTRASPALTLWSRPKSSHFCDNLVACFRPSRSWNDPLRPNECADESVTPIGLFGEPLALNQRVPGSSPGAPTNRIKCLWQLFLSLSGRWLAGGSNRGNNRAHFKSALRDPVHILLRLSNRLTSRFPIFVRTSHPTIVRRSVQFLGG